jgi:homeobox protein cut-like
LYHRHSALLPTTQELRKQFQVISELRAEIRSLQSDNLKLYEKVRYMQSYRENSAHSSLDPLPPSSTGAPSAGELSKYSARYEEAMNPFEAFRGRVRCCTPSAFIFTFGLLTLFCVQEAARAYSNLNPLERGVLVLTRAVLGNRRARNAFIVYAVALHALVMFTLYECTGSSSSQARIQPVPYPRPGI